MNEIEKLSERQYATVIEKLHTSVEGVQGLDKPISDDKPWLNSVEAVDRIVRGFTSDALAKYALVSSEWDIAKFTGWAQAECDRYNHLFLTYGLSDDTDYTRGVFNTPQNLGVFLLIANGMDGDASKAVRDVFMQHVIAVTRTFAQHAEEDVNVWGWKLDAFIEDLVANLMGLHEYDDDVINNETKI